MTRRLREAVSLSLPFLLLLLLTGAVAAADETAKTVVIDGGLDPARVEVGVGETVVWLNQDGQRRRIRSREGPERFDSGNLEPGEAFAFTFHIAGTYPYLDHRDEGDSRYFGSVVVGAAVAPGGPLPASAEITIVDRSYRPGALAAASGATITWTNQDGEAHTVTATDGSFDSGILQSGQSFEQAFAEAGTYDFFCAIHPEMRGTITIRDAGATTGSASPAPAQPTPASAAPASPEVASPSPAGSGARVSRRSTPPASAGAETTDVAIVDFDFEPASLVVTVGSSVTWTDQGEVGHTVTASDGSFDSGVLSPGDRFERTFDTAGTFDYLCAIHPQMTATVLVIDPSTG